MCSTLAAATQSASRSRTPQPAHPQATSTPATPPAERLRRALQPYVDSRAGADWAAALTATLPRLPVMTYAIFSRYVLMIHNTLTDQQLGLDALEGDLPQNGPSAALPAGVRDRSKIYAAEQAMLEMVRTGNINYHAVLQRSVQLSPGVPVQGQDPLRQMKTSIIVFTTLVCRAAMEGGLSPEVAYPLGDSYIQSAENSRDSGELNALASAMYHDFIYRVHHVRTNPTCSHAVQKVCDYIAFLHDGKLMLCEEKDALMEEYGVLHCRKEDFEAIDPAAVVGSSNSVYGMSAVVRRDAVPEGWELSPVSLEDLFVVMVKGA